MIQVLRLMGRCANGNEADKGSHYHAREGNAWKALCGIMPGRLSAGWADDPTQVKHGVEHVTCPKCRKKLRVRQLLWPQLKDCVTQESNT